MTYDSEVLADTPLVYWRLGESSGTNVDDATANNRDGTYVNSPTLGITGAISGDTGVSFNGSNQYAFIAEASWQNVTNVTVECWFKRSSAPSGVDYMVTRYDSGSSSQQAFQLAVTSGGVARFGVRGTSGGLTLYSGSTNICDGEWHHVVGTHDASTVRLYVDGVEEGSGSALAQNMRTFTGGLGVRVAIIENVSGITGYSAVSLDEIALYGTALSSSRIAAHFDAGVQPDLAAPAVAVTPGTVTVANQDQFVVPGATTVTVTPGAVTVGVDAQQIDLTAPTVTVTAGTADVELSQDVNLDAPTVAATPGGISVSRGTGGDPPAGGYVAAVTVWDEDNDGQLAALPTAFDVEWFETRNTMTGWCRLRVHVTAEGADDLAWRRVLHIVPSWTPRVYAYVIQSVTEVLLEDGAYAYQVQGLELAGAWLGNAIVHGEYGGANLDRRTGRERPFNFASREGAWRVASDWVAATQQVTWSAQSPQHPGAGQWYSPGSYWLARSPDPGVGGTLYFRRVWTLGGADDVPVTIHFATDDTTIFWLDGTKRHQHDGVDKLDSDNERQEYQDILVPGEHTFAFMIRDDVQWSGEAAQGELLFAMWEVNEAGERVGSPLLTSDSNWITANAPVGHTAGNVLKRLVDEARVDRDVLGLSNLTLGFDDDEDSNAAAWAQRREIQLPVLSALTETQVIPRLCVEYGVDCWVDGATNVLHLADRRGGTSGVTFALGTNVTQWSCRPIPLDASWLAVDSDEGWASVVDSALETSLAGRIESAFAGGGSPGVLSAEAAAEVELDERSTPTYDVSMEYAMSPGTEPGADFDLDDDVTVPGPGRVAGSARVMAYGVQIRPERTTCTVQLEWEG